MIKKILFRLAIALLIVLQAWSIYLTFTYPVTGLNVVQDASGDWAIQKFETDSLAAYSVLKVGDRIVKVDNQEPGRYFSIAKWHTVDQFHSLTISRDGQWITIVPDKSALVSKTYLFSLLGEVVSFFIALLLYFRLPNSRSARELAMVFADMGIIFMSLGASIRGDSLGKAAIFMSMLLLPVLFLRFLLVLVDEKGGIRFSYRFVGIYHRIAYGLSLLMLGFILNTPITYVLYRIASNIVLLFFVAGIAISIGFLALIYVKFRKQNLYASILIRTIWTALFVSFAPIVIFSFLPRLFFGQEWVNSFYMGWFSFILPITFAYLIASRRLYDIDILIRRILLTVTVSLLPSLAFVGITRALFPDAADLKHLVIIFTLSLLCTSFVLYSFEYFTSKLQPVMFPRKHQLQIALKKIATKLRTITSFQDLKGIILVDIVTALQVHGGAVVFKYTDRLESISEGDIDSSEVERLVQEENFSDTQYSLIEINRHEEYTSFLVISRKMTGTMLGTEELQWLNLITSYLAVSLENVYLIRKLTMKLEQMAMQLHNEDAARQLVWFRKMMFDLQERERTRIATDLHDTTMQDLFFLKQRLHALMEKIASTEEDRKQMDNILGYIDIINVNLRQSCFELHPYMLKEIGLVKTIRRLVEFEAPISPFELSFQASGVELIERKDSEMKRHIFRMVQELINNAKKHADASYIRMELSAVQGAITFVYEDDGVGFDVKRVAVGEIGYSGMGMDQIKSRIFSLNGKFELQTAKGQGVKITATIPLKEGLTA